LLELNDISQALAEEDDEEEPSPNTRAELRNHMGTILEDIDEDDPGFQRVAKYMQVRSNLTANKYTRPPCTVFRGIRRSI
jgi:hypothetical protein